MIFFVLFEIPVYFVSFIMRRHAIVIAEQYHESQEFLEANAVKKFIVKLPIFTFVPQYRAEKNCWYVVARHFFLALLSFFCLALPGCRSARLADLFSLSCTFIVPIGRGRSEV